MCVSCLTRNCGTFPVADDSGTIDRSNALSRERVSRKALQNTLIIVDYSSPDTRVYTHSRTTKRALNSQSLTVVLRRWRLLVCCEGDAAKRRSRTRSRSRTETCAVSSARSFVGAVIRRCSSRPVPPDIQAASCALPSSVSTVRFPRHLDIWTGWRVPTYSRKRRSTSAFRRTLDRTRSRASRTTPGTKLTNQRESHVDVAADSRRARASALSCPQPQYNIEYCISFSVKLRYVSSIRFGNDVVFQRTHDVL